MLAVRSCPGSTTVWALAAAMARAATSADPRTCRFRSQAGQACLADAADPIGAGVAGEQHQRSLVRGVVERPLQAGEHAGHQVAQPVDHPHSVGDQIRSMPGQHREVADQVGVGVDDRQVPAQAGGLGDDVGVLGVGLALAGIGSAHRRDHPPRRVTHRLAGRASNASSSADGAPMMSTAQISCLRQRGHRGDEAERSQPRRWRP